MTTVKCWEGSIMSKKISRGMLFGARGNSGVILSQIFRGIADGLKDLEKASVADIANAFVEVYRKSNLGKLVGYYLSKKYLFNKR